MKPKKNRLTGSGSLDLAYAIGNVEALKQRLLFHHIPKTGGSSFRAAVLRSLGERGFVRAVLPTIKETLRSVDAWPNGIATLLNQLGSPDAVLSHYTAFLAKITEDPILTVIREPDKQFWSNVNFQRWLPGMTPKGIARKSSNMQVRSLLRIEVPPWRPRKVAPWIGLVDEVVERFSVFRLEAINDLVIHCSEAYGLDIELGHKKNSSRTLDENLQSRIELEFDRRDPVWLDRMLYERVVARNKGKSAVG